MIHENIRSYWIGLDQIESDQIRLRIFEWIGSEQKDWIGARVSDKIEWSGLERAI